MNRLLLEQLSKLGISAESVPTADQWTHLISNISEAYDQLDTQEVQLKTVLESVPCLVMWVNFELTVLGANKQANQVALEPDLTHHQLSDLIGFRELTQFLITFFSSESFDEHCKLKIFRMGQEREYHFEIRKFGGGENAVIVGLDVSEEIKKEKELDRTRTKALSQSRMAALGEMASGMAHEINNPLAVIYAHSQQLQSKIEEDQYDKAEFLKKILKIISTAERIQRIIKGLRTFARDGETDPFASVSIKAIIDDTLELCVQRFKAHGVELRVDPIPEDLNIECRATQISQVVLNLLGNARDAVEKLDEKWVRLKIADNGISVKIYVTDSGKGITEEIANKIMTPFFTTKEVGVGTGLGLSISKGIIEGHGGKIYLDKSSVNTRFVLVLPKQQAKTGAA